MRPLSRQHQMYVELICQGLRTSDIARRSGRSQQTVKNSMRKLLSQLNARNRVHAVSIYLRNGGSPGGSTGGMHNRLTPNELWVLELAQMGLTYREISATLGTNCETTKGYMSRVRRRLKARTTAHALYIAIKAGIIE